MVFEDVEDKVIDEIKSLMKFLTEWRLETGA